MPVDGIKDAFAHLVRRHLRRVYNVSLCMVQDHEGVSEVTQEAFVAARQGLPSFRGEARFAGLSLSLHLPVLRATV